MPSTIHALPANAISPQNTRITFIGTALLISHQGTFTRFTGKFDLPDRDPTKAHISAQIDMDSVYTEVPLLTKHLKADDFFDVVKYPRSTFMSTRIQRSLPSPNAFAITGDFNIHGVTRSLTFPATIETAGNDLLLNAQITIRQSDFSMRSARTTTDQVPVTISARVRQR